MNLNFVDPVQQVLSSLRTSISIPQLSIPRSSSERDKHCYESSSELLDKFIRLYRRWQKEIPGDVEIHLLAVLQNGATIEISSMHAAGHNGLMVKGTIGENECIFFTHQASMQFLCHFKKVEQGKKKNVIGFGAESEADVEEKA